MLPLMHQDAHHAFRLHAFTGFMHIFDIQIQHIHLIECKITVKEEASQILVWT